MSVTVVVPKRMAAKIDLSNVLQLLLVDWAPFDHADKKRADLLDVHTVIKSKYAGKLAELRQRKEKLEEVLARGTVEESVRKTAEDKRVRAFLEAETKRKEIEKSAFPELFSSAFTSEQSFKRAFPRGTSAESPPRNR